jgi:predicted metalloprotease
MFWQGRRESDNVEDQRSMSRTTMAIGGGAGVVIVGLVAWLLGADPQALQNLFQGNPQGGQGQGEVDPAQEQAKKFVGVVLADTEGVWKDLFQKMGKTYREPKLVLFSGKVESACGLADAAVGPFYCPGDQKVYLDLDFFGELKSRFGAPGEFAQAYVIAHEVGHHVQRLLGYSKKSSRKGRLSDSVRLELQADYLAGVWAYHAQRTMKILEDGDLEAALRAANAIGDDTLQKKARGYVVPDSFTHGTSAQRVRWFKRGFETGDVSRQQLDMFFEADEL